MPFIPLIIAGAGIIGGVASSKIMAKSDAKNQAALRAQQQPFLDTQTKIAQEGLNKGMPFVDKAGAAYDTSLDFYKKILTGSDDDIMKLFNAGDYTKSADESQATSYNLMGRTGARAAVLGQTGEDRAAQIQKILEQIRLGAPAQIANIAQGVGNLGTNLIGASNSAATGASNIVFNEAKLAQEAADRRAQIVASIIGSAGTAAGTVYASQHK